MKTIARAASFLVAVAPALAGNVIVVDSFGPADFTEIQPAVDAAQDGDTILVRGIGPYGGFVIANKGLNVVSEPVSDIAGPVRVHHLAAGKAVVLQSLTVTGGTGIDSSRGLFLSDNAGSIRIESCTFVGSGGDLGSNLPDGWDGVRVSSCADVSFSRCVLRGGRGLNGLTDYPPAYPGTGGVGLSATQSTISAYETTIVGGSGQAGGGGTGPDGGNGGHGCQLDRSTLLASSCAFEGGDGGDGDSGTCLGAYGGDGAYALDLRATGNLARIQGCSESGGTIGCDYPSFHCWAHCNGTYGPRAGGTFEDLPSQPRRLHAVSPVREGDLTVLRFWGQPGDTVQLFVAGKPWNAYRAAWEGVLLVRPRPPPMVTFMGTVPSFGYLDVPWSIAALGPGVESSRRFLQPIFTDTQGNRRLGSLNTMIILDTGF